MIEMTVAGSIWASSVAFISTVATSRFRSSGRTRTPDTLPPMPESVSPILSQAQLETLAEHGEERTAEVGEVLFEVGDRHLPVHRDPRGRGGDPGRGRQRDRPSRRVGLPRRDQPALRADRLPDRRRNAADALHRRRPRHLRPLLFEDGPLSRPAALDLHRPPRGAAAAGGRRDRDRSGRAPRRRRGGSSSSPSAIGCRYQWRDPEHADDGRRAAARRARPGRSSRWSGCPGGTELRRPTQRRALAGARRRPASSEPREEVDLLVIGGGPAGLGAAVYGASEGLDTLGRREHRARRPGRHLAPDRELPRLPGRDQRHRADEPGGHPGAQVQAPAPPRPTAPIGARAGRRPPPRPARGGARGRGPRRRPRHRRRLPPAARRRTSTSTRASASSTPPARPRRSAAARPSVGVVGGGNSAGQAASGWPAAARSSPCCTAAPTSARRCPTT